MRTGLIDDLENIQDFRKTAIIDLELKRLNVDIVALQETRLPETGSLKEENYTFFWHGKGLDETLEHGVGFAVRNTLLTMITPMISSPTNQNSWKGGWSTIWSFTS